MTTRNGKRWTVNECLQLQREFELLNLTINEIANKHQRTPNAIMFKLSHEGFADYNSTFYNEVKEKKSGAKIKKNIMDCGAFLEKQKLSKIH